MTPEQVTAPTRCPTCDRPPATAEQWRDMEAEEGPDLCWGDPGCRYNAVDWRARALAAEAEGERLRETLGGRISALAAELERTQDALFAARRVATLAVRCHLSPSDDVRARGFREAMAAVDGWEVE
jgi:hypothetical protein